MEQSAAHFRAPAHQAWSSDGGPPCHTLDFAAYLYGGAKVQAAVQFDPQTAAAKVHQRNFVSVDQELRLALD
ncbi:MAG TPA: hypothetical protein VL860_06425, partial [Planctomycetota bacterium]|nr:hypothetical protein [Planctomycetota bacterium]